MSEQTQKYIREVCNELADFLCKKNEAYGDSAIKPIRIRSKASAIEQILVRQDDKLSRMFQGKEYAGDDDMKDLAGYWVLEEVARKIESYMLNEEHHSDDVASIAERVEKFAPKLEKDDAGVVYPGSCEDRRKNYQGGL